MLAEERLGLYTLLAIVSDTFIATFIATIITIMRVGRTIRMVSIGYTIIIPLIIIIVASLMAR